MRGRVYLLLYLLDLPQCVVDRLDVWGNEFRARVCGLGN